MADSGDDKSQGSAAGSDAEREDQDECWSAFMAYDHEQNGTMQTADIKAALERLGQCISENDCYRMISQSDPENTGYIQFSDFKNFISEKKESEKGTSDEDLLDAFVAMGGEPDGEGFIDADKLIDTIKNEFEMTIDIENLILKIDEDGSGEIEFDEFKELLRAAKKRIDAEGSDDDEFDEFNAFMNKV